MIVALAGLLGLREQISSRGKLRTGLSTRRDRNA
jgi:hypothetical protein